MKALTDELSIIGVPISEEDRVVYLLASLPESYNVLVTALEANSEVPKMEVVTERLLHEEQKLRDRASGMRSESAMMEYQRRNPVRCHYCKKLGHMQKYCADHARDEAITSSRKSKANKVDARQKVNKVEVQREESSISESEVIGLMVRHVLTCAESKCSGRWIVDSGATCHICNNVDHFINLQHLEKPMEVIMGAGHSLKVAKCGKVELYIRSLDGKDRS